MSILIKNTNILTMNSNREVLIDRDLRVVDNKISQIGKLEGLEGEKIIDGRGTVLMPGLINCHSHIAMSLFRNYGNDTDLHTWLNDYIWPVEAVMTGEDARAGVRLSLLEMARAGITTYVDMYDFQDVTAQETNKIGLRAYLAPGTTDNSIDDREREINDLAEKYNDKSGLVNIMIGPHAVYTCCPDTLKRLRELGSRLNLRFHIHLSETQKEEDDCLRDYGKSPTALLNDLGLVEKGTIFAHGIYLSDEDMDIIARKGATIVYNPVSNLKLGSGILDLQKLKDKGINVAIGTDGPSSNNCQDLFRDMTIGSFIQKGFNKDPKAAPAASMLEMATINGAKALSRELELGSIEEGKLADLILVNFDNVRHCPKTEDIKAALIYSTQSDDVCLTMVNGRIIYEKGKLLTEDEEAIKLEAQEACDRLLSRRT